ncbi:unnamed protein product [Lota lota]
MVSSSCCASGSARGKALLCLLSRAQQASWLPGRTGRLCTRIVQSCVRTLGLKSSAFRLFASGKAASPLLPVVFLDRTSLSSGNVSECPDSATGLAEGLGLQPIFMFIRPSVSDVWREGAPEGGGSPPSFGCTQMTAP